MRWFCTPFLFLFLLLLASPATTAIQEDINGDGRIGLAEAIHALKAASESPDGSDLLTEAVYALQVTAGVSTSIFDETPVLALMSAKGTTALDIAWVPGGDGATPQDQIDYNIHLSTDEDFTPGPATLVKTVTGESQTEVTGLIANTMYYGSVVAVYGTTISEPSNHLQTKTFEFEAVPNPSAVVSIAEDLGLGPHTTADGITLTYDSGGTLPAVGSILYSEDTNGVMIQRLVDSVLDSGGIITVVTSDVSLTDVIDRGSIYNSLQLFDVASKAPTIQSGSNALASASMSTLSDGSQVSRIEWKDRLLTAEQTTFNHKRDNLVVTPMGQASVIELFDPRAASSEFTATVTADFEPALVTTAEWGGLIPTQLDSAQVAARGTLSLTALAQYQFTAAGSVTDAFQLFSRTWVSVYQVGAVPVYQEITLSMDVQVSASAQAEITATAEAVLAETVELGATYDGVSWTPYITNTESESFTASLNIVGGASAEIRLIPKIEIRFYTVIGGALSVEPYAESSLGFENTTLNSDFLLAHPERAFHLTSFGASLGIEAKVEVTLTALGNSWDILPSTCVLGTGTCLYTFDPLTLFSIPKLELSVVNYAPPTIDIKVEITDGTNNVLDQGSVEWEVFPDDGIIVSGPCTKVGEVTTCTASVTSGAADEYTAFVSGHGVLDEIARQFREKLLVDECTYTANSIGYSMSCLNEAGIEVLYNVHRKVQLHSEHEIYGESVEVWTRELTEPYYTQKETHWMSLDNTPSLDGIIECVGPVPSGWFVDYVKFSNNGTWTKEFVSPNNIFFPGGYRHYDSNQGGYIVQEACWPNSSSSGGQWTCNDYACRPMNSIQPLDPFPGDCTDWWGHYDNTGTWVECDTSIFQP